MEEKNPKNGIEKKQGKKEDQNNLFKFLGIDNLDWSNMFKTSRRYYFFVFNVTVTISNIFSIYCLVLTLLLVAVLILLGHKSLQLFEGYLKPLQIRFSDLRKQNGKLV